MTLEALLAAWREAERRYEREHTTPFLWEQPERFTVRNVSWEIGRDASRTHRIVVDYAEDYAGVRAGFDALWTPARPTFTVGEIVSFLDAHPEVRCINEARFGVSWQRIHAADLRSHGGDWRVA